jgi:RNA polymerase sigma factor (sigma-70 family)
VIRLAWVDEKHFARHFQTFRNHIPVSLSSYPTGSLASLASQAELERVFASWHSEILGLLYHLLGSWEEARQGLQATFSQCWQARKELDSVENMKSWVFAHALRTVHGSRSAAWKRSQASLDSTQIVYDLEAAASAQLVFNARMEKMKASIFELPQAAREVFLLRENGEFAYDEIAVLLHLPVAKVKAYMQQALAQLQIAAHS